LKLFDFSLRFNGYKISQARKFLSNIQRIKSGNFEDYVFTRRKKIVDYHLKNNSFYSSLAKNVEIDNWNSVPIITKRDLQQPIEQRLSKGFSKANVYINKTSGSSGDPFIFAKDKESHALTWALIMDRFSWYNIDFNSSLQARFFGIPLDKKGYYKERLKDWFSNRYRFSIFDLSDAAFDNVLKKFQNTSFDYINGYTSPIVQFAKFLERKKINLKTVCPSLKVCFVTSEMLFENDKKLMETVIGIPVINEYGASELDLIAFQNMNNEFQLNSESLYIEIINNKDEVLPNGEEGRIVITSLYNKAHPFIRYDIGDIGVISEDSTFKKPILKKLVGRTNDIAILPSGKKAAGLTFYYITKSIIENDGNVKEFIIEQTELSEFKVSYVSYNELSGLKKDIIRKEMINYLEQGIDITFERCEKLNRSKSGKLKQFTSYIKPDK